MELIAGSVVAFPIGTVELGNAVDDTTVRVRMGELLDGELASVIFLGRVVPEVVNQGTFRVGGIPFLTDDPTTPEPDDANVSPVTSTTGADCADRVDDLGDAIDALIGDPDDDAVIGARDDCAGTAAGIPVDSRGCTQADFCGTFDVSSGPGRAACNNADWGNDEPLVDAEDCHQSHDVWVAR